MRELIDYYAERVPEYDRIYAWPERQSDLRCAEQLVCDALSGHRILELACGTGYWTEKFATVAESVVATDLCSEMLERAGERTYPPGRVSLTLSDALRPDTIPGDFTAVFVGHLWSHVHKSQIEGWLSRIGRRLGPGGLVLFLDNRFVEGGSTPVSRTDEDGDTYQVRRLDGGSEHEIIKNFPSEDELRRAVAGFGSEVEIDLLTYYWLLRYRVVEST